MEIFNSKFKNQTPNCKLEGKLTEQNNSSKRFIILLSNINMQTRKIYEIACKKCRTPFYKRKSVYFIEC